MKGINFIIVIFFVISCKAQTPIKSLYEDSIEINGAYYKDTYNDFDKFVGTWKYTSGSTSLTITLQKKLQYHEYESNGYDYYLDMLVGEYKYIENGVEKINTLPKLLQNLSPFDYNIFGYTIIGPNSQYCLNCVPTDRKVLLGFDDPTRDIEGYEPEMIFERVDSGTVKKLKLNFRSISGMIIVNGITPAYSEYTIPFGEYVLIKQ